MGLPKKERKEENVPSLSRDSQTGLRYGGGDPNLAAASMHTRATVLSPPAELKPCSQLSPVHLRLLQLLQGDAHYSPSPPPHPRAQ